MSDIKTTITGPGTKCVTIDTTAQELFDLAGGLRDEIDTLEAAEGPHVASMVVAYTLGVYLGNIHAAIDVTAPLAKSMQPLAEAYLATVRMLADDGPVQ